MRRLVCALIAVARLAAATPGFLLGLDYTEYGVVPYFPNATQIAYDASGALYVLHGCNLAPAPGPSCLTKVSPDGKSAVWERQIGFPASMAVDPNGGVYLATEPAADAQSFTASVEKLSADGTGALWKTDLGAAGITPLGINLAVDSLGRVLVAGPGLSGVIRLNSGGAVDRTTPLTVPGTPVSIAVDATGSYVLLGVRSPAGAWNLARLAKDGATWLVQLALPAASLPPSIAVAVNGDALVYGWDPSGAGLTLWRINPDGAVLFTRSNPGARGQVYPAGGALTAGGLALDAAGDVYITGDSPGVLHPSKNSLAPCGTGWLSVFGPDGTLYQTTYLQGGNGVVAVAAGPNSSVMVLEARDPTLTPTQTGPFAKFPYGPGTVLFHLSPHANPQTFPLACAGNALTYELGAIAPGELLSLFGNGLGPEQGIAMQATPQSPFPTRAANVEVTFDGHPAPLLWVQDAQINVVVPWSVSGSTTQFCVSYNGVRTNCLIWPVTAAAPTVLTVDGVYAAALNQDGTLNSAENPAAPDAVVSIFATGLGPIDPPQTDGALIELPLPNNVLPVSLVVPCAPFLGSNCPVPPISYVPLYAGPAPFLVAGASQVNLVASQAGGKPLAVAVQAPSGGQLLSNGFLVHVAQR